jgi:hypothetical protein
MITSAIKLAATIAPKTSIVNLKDFFRGKHKVITKKFVKTTKTGKNVVVISFILKIIPLHRSDYLPGQPWEEMPANFLY